MHFQKHVFLDRLCLFRNKFLFDRCLEKCFLGCLLFFFVGQKSMEKAIPKLRPANNTASQKAKQSPTKNRFKFQNNNPKNGASARGASVVVLKFVSIFCWTWLGFLAELFFGWIFAPDFLRSIFGSIF